MYVERPKLISFESDRIGTERIASHGMEYGVCVLNAEYKIHWQRSICNEIANSNALIYKIYYK